MPNWCDNFIEVTHEDPAMMQRFKKAFDEGKLLQEFVPCPEELFEEAPVGNDWQERKLVLLERNTEKYGHADWYGWCIENWGTKWDISEGELDYSPEENNAGGYFNSAWAPPVQAMEAMTELGFKILLRYYEPGMSFVGEYTSENGDECYSYDFEDEDWKDDIPETLIEHFNLVDEYENWVECNKEYDDDQS
jgi:hypothetical protein